MHRARRVRRAGGTPLSERVRRALAPAVIAKAAGIRVVVSDIDGVWTDGGMYYSAAGDELKKFNTRDGMGVELLRSAGIPVVILTRETTPIVARRAKKLGLERWVLQGVREKAPRIVDIARAFGVEPWEVAYIGDDVNDVDAMQLCGLSGTVADGAFEARELADYVCERKGGEGAFREFAEVIVYARSHAGRCTTPVLNPLLSDSGPWPQQTLAMSCDSEDNVAWPSQ